MRRTRIIAMILGTAAIITVGFMLFAFVQKIESDRQKVLAEQQKTEAERQKSLADSTAVVATEARAEAVTNASIAEQKAEEARIEKDNAERQRKFAVANAELAKQNERLANIQKDSATIAKELALQNEQIAKREREEALRLRMLSVGKSMSIKSLQVQGEQDLQTLLAYQAYLFNKKNAGPGNDADIYNGLYNVAKQYGNVNYKTFKGHSGAIRSIAFVPGKNEFYTSGDDGKVLKWITEGTNQTFQVIYSGADIIEVLAVSPDESWLAAGSGNSAIRMIPLKGNSMQYELLGHKGKIKSLVFSFDGKFLYSASLDGKVLKWDMSARTSTNISNGTMQITSIDISAKGDLIAGVSSDGNVLVWNPENNTEYHRLGTSLSNIKVVRFKPDEDILAIGDVNGNVELWNTSTRLLISRVKAHNAQVNDIRFNTSYKQMATASNDKTIKLFNNLEDLTEPPVTLSDNEGWVLVVQFSPDGQLIVSGTYEGANNLVGRPVHADLLVRDICTLVSRNLNQDEWNTYVGRDIPLEKTCQDQDYNIKVNIKR
jgi:WD40 repeat protein